MDRHQSPHYASLARTSQPRWRPLALSLLVVAALASCSGTRRIMDPVVRITTAGGSELGVSTEHGIVFLGRTAERDELEVEAYFGDGPSIESSVIEPVGGGLFTAELDIKLQHVRLSFTEPRDGETLEIIGRKGSGRWTAQARVRTDPRVLGLLLEIPSGFRDDPDQVGAGVYRKKSKFDRELVGLVTGKIQLERRGKLRKYLTVAGPTVLWRFVAHRRDHMRHKPFVYREDIL